MSRTACVLLSLLLASVTPALAQGAPSPESCPGTLTAWPDVGACFAAGTLIPDGEVKLLWQISCVVDKIDVWGAQQLECLQRAVERRQRIILYPDALRRPIDEVRKIARQVRTLKDQVGQLACGWRFSPRTRVLEGLYLNPLKLCRPSFQSVFGSHDRFGDAGLQEMLDWSSVTTHNLIQERTIGREPGKSGPPAGPEFSWQRIAAEGVRDLTTSINRPGQAVRFTAQYSADGLQVEASTLQLRTQALLVEQQSRDYRRMTARQGRAYALFLLSELEASGRDAGLTRRGLRP
jgi:hypothetical protein